MMPQTMVLATYAARTLVSLVMAASKATKTTETSRIAISISIPYLKKYHSFIFKNWSLIS